MGVITLVIHSFLMQHLFPLTKQQVSIVQNGFWLSFAFDNKCLHKDHGVASIDRIDTW